LLARSTGLAFYTLHTSDIMGGALQTDKRLMELLTNAARNAPALIFIDEIDLIGKCRDSGPNPQADGVLRQLLQLIDEIEKTPKLYLVAATNRSDLVDEALKRPGRLSKVISTNVPDFDEREAIFRLCLSRLSVDDDLDLYYAVEKSEGASGATIKAICNQAGINSLQRFNLSEDLQGNWSINDVDLQEAVDQYMRSRLSTKLSLVSGK
jgi:transitional endoplasmic reticulum ATPase